VAYLWQWHWPAPPPGALHSLADLRAMTPLQRITSRALPVAPRPSWPPLTELSALRGHTAAIASVKWSCRGTQLATAAADGSARLFVRRAPPLPGAPLPSAAASLQWLPGAVLRCHPLEGSRSRKAEVVQIEWSRDDAAVLAVVSDQTIRVFDAASGRPLHVLSGHSGKLYELSTHPRLPGLVASWARDGTIVLWDHTTGEKLKVLHMAHTYPGRGRWTSLEPLGVLEGTWSPDGSALYATDAAGQLHIYGLGSADVCGRAAYDQFFKIDYQDMTVDPLTNTARSSASGRLPHLDPDARVPVSIDATPYSTTYSALARANRLTRGTLLTAATPRNCT
jgi:WD40 repeat protein